MAYKVYFTPPTRELGKSDLEFFVERNGSVLGRLLVSKGAVVWRQKGKSKKGKKLSWRRFHNLIHKYGKPEQRKRKS